MPRPGYALGQDRGRGGRAGALGRGPLPGRDREPARGRATAGRAAGRQARPAPIQARLDDAPDGVRAIAWKARLRLRARYRRLVAAGKDANLVTTAIAREMAAFAWAIACQVRPVGAAA